MNKNLLLILLGLISVLSVFSFYRYSVEKNMKELLNVNNFWQDNDNSHTNAESEKNNKKDQENTLQPDNPEKTIKVDQEVSLQLDDREKVIYEDDFNQKAKNSDVIIYSDELDYNFTSKMDFIQDSEIQNTVTDSATVKIIYKLVSNDIYSYVVNVEVFLRDDTGPGQSIYTKSTPKGDLLDSGGDCQTCQLMLNNDFFDPSNQMNHYEIGESWEDTVNAPIPTLENEFIKFVSTNRILDKKDESVGIYFKLENTANGYSNNFAVHSSSIYEYIVDKKNGVLDKNKIISIESTSETKMILRSASIIHYYKLTLQ